MRAVTGAVPSHASFASFLRAFSRKLAAQQPLIIGIAVTAALWQIGSTFAPPIIMPPLQNIVGATWHIFSKPDLLIQLLTTGVRVLVAMIASFAVGIALGILMGTFDKVREYVKPQLHIVQGIPSVSWVVFAAIWFANAELRIAFIIFIATMPAFALQIDSAARNVNLEWIHLSAAFRSSLWQRLRMVVLPAIVPELISSWVVNMGWAVRVAMIAELIGSNTGVGYQLLYAQSVFDMAGAIAWTLALVILLSVFQAVTTSAELWFLAWRPREEHA